MFLDIQRLDNGFSGRMEEYRTIFEECNRFSEIQCILKDMTEEIQAVIDIRAELKDFLSEIKSVESQVIPIRSGDVTHR